jgi:tRNA U34 2-thiouridine synthase MnmA/TrmU
MRYHAKPLPCRARETAPGTLELDLDEPAFAVAPGQLGCLMHDDCVVGQGTIGEPA